jgi:hypothetical protein
MLLVVSNGGIPHVAGDVSSVGFVGISESARSFSSGAPKNPAAASDGQQPIRAHQSKRILPLPAEVLATKKRIGD